MGADEIGKLLEQLQNSNLVTQLIIVLITLSVAAWKISSIVIEKRKRIEPEEKGVGQNLKPLIETIETMTKQVEEKMKAMRLTVESGRSEALGARRHAREASISLEESIKPTINQIKEIMQESLYHQKAMTEGWQKALELLLIMRGYTEGSKSKGE